MRPKQDRIRRIKPHHAGCPACQAENGRDTKFAGRMMKRVAALMILFLAAGNEAQAYLRAGPEIASVAIDAENPDVIRLGLSGLPCEAAVSADGGLTFTAASEADVARHHWVSSLSAGSRRYVLADSIHLLRSDDAGITWTSTSATSFLREQSQAEVEKEKEWFRNEYGARLPQRSALWHPVFAAYACGYFLLALFLLRSQGAVRALLTGLLGLVVLFILWSFICGIHAAVMDWTGSQYPMAYWNTSSQSCPSWKLGLAMTIASSPWPLVVYLLFLWPVLPGSFDILNRTPAGARRRAALALAVAAGTAFVAFHLGMVFIGYFWE